MGLSNSLWKVQKPRIGYSACVQLYSNQLDFFGSVYVGNMQIVRLATLNLHASCAQYGPRRLTPRPRDRAE